MPSGTGATVMVRMFTGVAVDAGVGVGDASLVGPRSDVPSRSRPQAAPALARFSKSPSPAALIASAISPGPPSWSRRHTVPSRSSGRNPIPRVVASHSSSFRHATVTENAAVLPAMALPGSPSMPAVMTFLGSMTSNPARTQSDVSWLSGSGPGTNPARKILARVSSSRYPMSLACSSLNVWPGPARVRASLSGSSPIHASSSSDSSESIAPESCNRRGASTPRGAGVAVGSGVEKLAGVAALAAVGLSACDSVGTGVSVGVGVGAAVGAGVAVGSGAWPEQAARVAKSTRMVMVAGRRLFSTEGVLFCVESTSHSTCPSSHSSRSSFRNLGALATLSMSCLRTSGPCSPGPVEVKIPAGARRGFWAVCCNAPELFRSVGLAGSGAPAPRPCSGLGLPLCRWQWGLPSRPWPRPVWQPIPWPFGRRPVGR